MLSLLWGRTAGLDQFEAERLCELLDDLSLFVDYTADWVRLHDIIGSYLRETGRGRLATHAALLDAAAERLIGPSADPFDAGRRPWWRLPESADYVWRHVCWHLAGAGRLDELRMLVTDLRWVEARLRNHGPAAIDSDLALTLDHVTDPTVAALWQALRQNAHLLGPPTSQALADTLAIRLADAIELEPIVRAYTASMAGAQRLSQWWPLPDSPHVALRRVLTGHTGHVENCRVAPDGSWLVTTSKDHTVRVWDPASGLMRQTLTHAHDEIVVACAIAPDGSWLATGDAAGTIILWDPGTWSPRQTLVGHAGEVTTCVAAPDGTWLATTSSDRTARIGTYTGSLLTTLIGHTDKVVACAVAPDGSWIATSSQDSTVIVWDPDSGTARSTLRGHSGWVVVCLAAPDGSGWRCRSRHGRPSLGSEQRRAADDPGRTCRTGGRGRRGTRRHMDSDREGTTTRNWED